MTEQLLHWQATNGCVLCITAGPTSMVAHFDGDLDARSLPAVRDGLLRMCQSGGDIVLDLWDVSILDLQAARLFAALARRAYSQGIRVRLRAPVRHLQAIVAAAATRPFLLA